MDRVIIYPGQIPLETDLLQTNKNMLIGLSKFAAGVLGTTAIANGLPCTPTTPASLAVEIGAGELYQLAAIDATDYSSLDADARQVFKQGLLFDPVTLNTPAPGTAGHSINYLIQGRYTETDDTSVLLPYYNAADPTEGYSGPNDNGVSQNTNRGGKITLSVKAGTSATTGTQVTPTPDSGYLGLWVVTVANGASSVLIGDVVSYSDDSFIQYTLPELAKLLAARDAQVFSASGTWTKPQGVNLIIVEAFGAGGGGGSGRRGAASSDRIGGGGGGGGSSALRFINAADLPSTVTVTIGAGGSGGASIASDSTSGMAGADGGATSFGSFLTAFGGGGGEGGNSTAPSVFGGGGATPLGAAVGVTQGPGLSGSTPAGHLSGTGAIGGPGTYNVGAGAGRSSYSAGAGGGGGAGIGVDNTPATAGYAGGSFTDLSGGGGAAGTTASRNGSNGPFRMGGGGGCPGDASGVSAGGSGGIGGQGGGGGGGGGASANGANSGAGGSGGNGYCRVLSY